MGENGRIFWPDRHDVYESDIKKKIRKLMLGYSSLHEFLSIGKIPDDAGDSMQFYSELFDGMKDLLTDVINYAIITGYMYKRKRVKNAIDYACKILGCLKILHDRYLVSITSSSPIDDPRWYQESEKTNQKLEEDMIEYFDKVYSFKFEDEG